MGGLWGKTGVQLRAESWQPGSPGTLEPPIRAGGGPGRRGWRTWQGHLAGALGFHHVLSLSCQESSVPACQRTICAFLCLLNQGADTLVGVKETHQVGHGPGTQEEGAGLEEGPGCPLQPDSTGVDTAPGREPQVSGAPGVSIP